MAQSDDQAEPSITADEALARLAAGTSGSFAERHAFRPYQRGSREAGEGPAPICDDPGLQRLASAPELVFDAGFGELFVVRVAGNVIPRNPGYAALCRGTSAHSALRRARSRRLRGGPGRACREVAGVGPAGAHSIVARTHPARAAERQCRVGAEAQLEAAVEANVRWSMRQVLETPEGKARMAEGRLMLVGAVYDLKSGRVRFLS